MKTAMPAGLMSSLQARAPSLATPVKMKLKPGDSKLMSNQINRTAPTQAALPLQVEKDPFGKFGSASLTWADSMGRAMARDDMEKAARAEALEQIGIAVGAELPKIAGIGASALALAKAHPGAAIGGGLGALHGLMNGGLGSAVVEGGVGAGVGAGAQYGLGKAMEHPDYGGKLRAAKDQLMSKLKGGAPPAPPGATLLGVAPQKTIMGVAPPATKMAAMRDELTKIAAHDASKIQKALSGATGKRVSEFTEKVEGHLQGRLKKLHHASDGEKAKHLSKATKLHDIKEQAEGASFTKSVKEHGAKRDNYNPPPKPKGTMNFDEKGRAQIAHEPSVPNPTKPNWKGRRSHTEDPTPYVVGGGIGALGGMAYGAHAGAKHEKAMNKKREERRAKKEEQAKTAEAFYKEAFGAALAGLARSAVPAITNFVKANPLKAGLGAASAVGNFASARKNGEGLGSALISGASGAASAL